MDVNASVSDRLAFSPMTAGTGSSTPCSPEKDNWKRMDDLLTLVETKLTVDVHSAALVESIDFPATVTTINKHSSNSLTNVGVCPEGRNQSS